MLCFRREILAKPAQNNDHFCEELAAALRAISFAERNSDSTMCHRSRFRIRRTSLFLGRFDSRLWHDSVRSESEGRWLSCRSPIDLEIKVGPAQGKALSRLEFFGALLAAQLWEQVAESLKADGSVQFWTDSICVLHWIRSSTGKWTTFVANSVATKFKVW